MGSEAALEFDAMVHAYYSLAYKYGLWNAASIMCNGCTDDGFWDFLGWLIAQGREVYMAALDDPDSLAELPVCKNYWFPDIAYVGDTVYHRMTKYMQPGELEWRIANHNDTWNPNCEEIQIARATEKEEEKGKD